MEKFVRRPGRPRIFNGPVTSITFFLPEELGDALNAISKAKGISTSAYLRSLVVSAIKGKR